MKYQQTKKWFKLPIGKKWYTVRPYNAETTRTHKRDVNWSQGFTSFFIKETGRTGFCGTIWFEEHAQNVSHK